MIPHARKVLGAVGYVRADGQGSDGLVLRDGSVRSASDAARLGPLLSTGRGGLGADAVFRVGTSPVIVFKSSPEPTDAEHEWHGLAWNIGVAPLLWVTTPQYVRLYNAYQPPMEYEHSSPLLKEFKLTGALDRALAEVEAVCGRRHVAMGAFWRSGLEVPAGTYPYGDRAAIELLGCGPALVVI